MFQGKLANVKGQTLSFKELKKRRFFQNEPKNDFYTQNVLTILEKLNFFICFVRSALKTPFYIFLEVHFTKALAIWSQG